MQKKRQVHAIHPYYKIDSLHVESNHLGQASPFGIVKKFQSQQWNLSDYHMLSKACVLTQL